MDQIPIEIMKTMFLEHVSTEFDRACGLFPSTKFLGKALSEEVGELAQAELEQMNEPDKGVLDADIYSEAVQTACVAMRIALQGEEGTAYKPVEGISAYAGQVATGTLHLKPPKPVPEATATDPAPSASEATMRMHETYLKERAAMK